MIRVLRGALVLALLAVAAVTLGLPKADVGDDRSPTEPSAPTPTAAPPTLTKAEANQQDRVGRAHRQRETRAFDRRPLLAALPLELGGVRIDISGLARDGRMTLLRVSSGPRGEDFARGVYRRALAAFGDDGSAYAVRWTP